jgi:hypothetical protein
VKRRALFAVSSQEEKTEGKGARDP